MVVWLLAAATLSLAHAQGGGGGFSCSDTTDFTGSANHIAAVAGGGRGAAPLRGNVGCVDMAAKALRTAGGGVNIFGPMENGFSSAQMSCLQEEVPGGVDTNLADMIINHRCAPETVQVLDYCGGHTQTYHYHERLSCLYTATVGGPVEGHSSRVGTAGDGRGIYGKYIAGGVLPTDLDACNGRVGMTPDGDGSEQYYYMITDHAPFTVGCYGPATLAQCRELYSGCGATTQPTTFATAHGSGEYALDCPCYDADYSNVAGQGRPGYLPHLAPAPTASPTTPTTSPTTPTAAPTGAPTLPTPPTTTSSPTVPTAAPTASPSPAPSMSPSPTPSMSPSVPPSAAPTTSAPTREKNLQESAGWQLSSSWFGPLVALSVLNTLFG